MQSNDTFLMDNTANGNYWEGICIDTCINITLIGNTANNNMDGIEISVSDNNTLTGNTANNNGDGIYLYESNYNILTGNMATNNSYAIYLFYSNFTSVIGNTLTENRHCFYEYGCIQNVIENNDCGAIPSFAGSSIILGLLITILVGIGIKKKLELHHVLKNIF
jgi:parallel beta-helix repeat protein